MTKNKILTPNSTSLVDLNGVELELDPLVNSMPTTSTFHHLGHEGKVFLHSDKHSVAAGADFDFLIKVTASPTARQIHIRFAYLSSIFSNR